jgi:hypothetical protein
MPQPPPCHRQQREFEIAGVSVAEHGGDKALLLCQGGTHGHASLMRLSLLKTMIDETPQSLLRLEQWLMRLKIAYEQ